MRRFNIYDLNASTSIDVKFIKKKYSAALTYKIPEKTDNFSK